MTQSSRVDPLTTVRRRISALRVCFVFSLLAAGAACGYISYSIVTQLEESVALNTYYSVVASALQNSIATTKRKVEGSRLTASIMKHACPSARMWPYCRLDGYSEIADQIASQSSTLTQALNVIIRSDQVEEFESFATETYRRDGYPDTAGVSDSFGFGIFGRHPNGTRYPWREQDNERTSREHDIVVPIFLHNNKNSSSVLYDVYSREVTGSMIDAQLKCGMQAKLEKNSAHCASISGFIELIVRPGPAAVLYQPIYPANDPYTQVAIAGTTLHWEEVLYNAVPDYIQGPLIAVISTGTEFTSYIIDAGVPTFLGYGDHHDVEYTKFGEGATLTDFLESNAGSTSYQLTFYPSDELFVEFHTYSPLALCFGFVGVMCFSVFVFLVYDCFVKHESHQRKAILEVKRRFVRFISHEIRTPLNTVCMGLELLKEDLQKAREPDSLSSWFQSDQDTERKLKEWHEIAADIAQNSADSVFILNDLLNYDKIESGSLRLDLDEEDPISLVNDIMRLLRVEARHRGIDLQFTYQNKIPTPMVSDDVNNDEDQSGQEQHVCLLIDSGRLGQVIRNVISNALKFTPRGGAIVVKLLYVCDKTLVLSDTVSDYARDHTQIGTAYIQVQDSGVGMTTDQLRQLYGEGVQFDANKLQAGGGSGLGLWVSKGIVESHGGNLCAESEGLERGSTFTVQLPLYQSLHSDSFCNQTEATHLEISARDADIEPPGTAGHSVEPKRVEDGNAEQTYHILVAEDSVPNRKMLVRLLERKGHTCETACDGQEAVNAVKAKLSQSDEEEQHGPPLFDIILMDFQMPNLNGPEATKFIRGLGFTGTVLGVTGNVLKEDVDFFIEHGANEVLSKPVQYSNIEAALLRAAT